MPKNINEFNQLEEVTGRVGGRKVDWDDVANQIIKTGVSWNVREIWEKFVKGKVTMFRTRNALDTLCRDKEVNGKVIKATLRRRWDGKRFWYGR